MRLFGNRKGGDCQHQPLIASPDAEQRSVLDCGGNGNVSDNDVQLQWADYDRRVALRQHQPSQSGGRPNGSAPSRDPTSPSLASFDRVHFEDEPPASDSPTPSSEGYELKVSKAKAPPKGWKKRIKQLNCQAAKKERKDVEKRDLGDSMTVDLIPARSSAWSYNSPRRKSDRNSNKGAAVPAGDDEPSQSPGLITPTRSFWRTRPQYGNSSSSPSSQKNAPSEEDDVSDKPQSTGSPRQVLITVKEGKQLVTASQVTQLTPDGDIRSSPADIHSLDEYDVSPDTASARQRTAVRDLRLQSDKNRLSNVRSVGNIRIQSTKRQPSTAQRAARWLAGIENGGFRKEDYENDSRTHGGSAFGDDSAFFDESASQTSGTTGDDTRYTFYTDYTGTTGTTGATGITDYTTDTTTDTTDGTELSEGSGDNALYGSKTGADASSSVRHNDRRRRRRRDHHYVEEDVTLFQAVADDLNLVARFLVADGTACLSCVADTTRESVQGLRGRETTRG